MGDINKTLTVLVILTICSPIALFVQSAQALSIPTPSVPQFTVKFVDRSYDVPKTSWITTDPNTGEQVTTYTGGNHVVNRTIDVTITNQPFTPISQENGTIQIYYNVRAKGHFEEWQNAWGGQRMMKIAPQSSSGSTTTVTFVLGSVDPPYYDIAEGKEDFQVKAVAGAYEQLHAPSLSDLITGGNIIFNNYTESDWSNIQTLDVPASIPHTNAPDPSMDSTAVPTSTSSNTPTDSILDNQQTMDLALILTVAVLGIAVAFLLVYVRRSKKR